MQIPEACVGVSSSLRRFISRNHTLHRAIQRKALHAARGKRLVPGFKVVPYQNVRVRRSRGLRLCTSASAKKAGKDLEKAGRSSGSWE